MECGTLDLGISSQKKHSIDQPFFVKHDLDRACTIWNSGAVCPGHGETGCAHQKKPVLSDKKHIFALNSRMESPDSIRLAVLPANWRVTQCSCWQATFLTANGYEHRDRGLHRKPLLAKRL